MSWDVVFDGNLAELSSLRITRNPLEWRNLRVMMAIALPIKSWFYKLHDGDRSPRAHPLSATHPFQLPGLNG